MIKATKKRILGVLIILILGELYTYVNEPIRQKLIECNLPNS